VKSPRDSVRARAQDLELVRGELLWTLATLAGDMSPIGPGWSFRTPALPLVWSLNQIRITAPASAPDVVALADEHQAELPYRHIVVDDMPEAAEIADDFSRAGWQVDREVLMSLTDPPDRVVDTSRVTELSEDQMLSLVRRWASEDHPGVGEDALDQLDEYNRGEGRLWQEQRLGVLDRDGNPVAITKLRAHGRMSWVEDVYTVAEARGQGAARALVTHATELARRSPSDVTFIIADDNDWPKELYARIGFRPIGFELTFHRAVGQDR